jgi:mannose/fructose/N-acetylgalactosamine-specific phosphotransferase system component IIB
MKLRLYRIVETATQRVRLIEATNAAQAMKHVAETTHTCAVVTSTSEAARLVSGGIKVESVGKGDAV